MNEQQFARRVARLNANILYLCFSQNVDLSLIRSNETIHNLLQLLHNSADLGRYMLIIKFICMLFIIKKLITDKAQLK